ncbi:hypothetical protein BO86DRAFT_149639 [Aspergillus japonicus CBS 114.51]|uniref:Uncharacterized protein n=1 Tax=Aspergillus japonicus CBS 114.51 TaxID=1448312 RepID=A0A8T8WUL5_ASPJA|nr:hypothetical protein BO86DRAFT_149639 [Aspergillus japonicus CBS 114.51]RAH79536.1 hypothetical protein BO86DRAFT_149639 [Aspergillus japonicus CBS 114.51]
MVWTLARTPLLALFWGFARVFPGWGRTALTSLPSWVCTRIPPKNCNLRLPTLHCSVQSYTHHRPRNIINTNRIRHLRLADSTPYGGRRKLRLDKPLGRMTRPACQSQDLFWSDLADTPWIGPESSVLSIAITARTIPKLAVTIKPNAAGRNKTNFNAQWTIHTTRKAFLPIWSRVRAVRHHRAALGPLYQRGILLSSAPVAVGDGWIGAVGRVGHGTRSTST